MSWKLFWQIVLLMVVGALVLASFKYGLLQYKYGCRAKYLQEHPEKMQKIARYCGVC